MTESSPAPMRTWLAAPMDRDVSEAIERLRHAPDVKQIAVMPDVHLATDVCIGVVVATSHLIYHTGVGSDIGCGMLAVALTWSRALGRSVNRGRRSWRRSVVRSRHGGGIAVRHLRSRRISMQSRSATRASKRLARRRA